MDIFRNMTFHGHQWGNGYKIHTTAVGYLIIEWIKPDIMVFTLPMAKRVKCFLSDDILWVKFYPTIHSINPSQR